MACLHRMLRLLIITFLMFMLLLSLNMPSLSLSPSSISSVAVASAAPTENEPGHVSDESMNVDHESIREDFENIKVAREFYLQRTGALRRAHNCSDFVPESFRGVLAPQLSDPTYNATAAAIAREVLGSTMCVVLSSNVSPETETGFALLNEYWIREDMRADMQTIYPISGIYCITQVTSRSVHLGNVISSDPTGGCPMCRCSRHILTYSYKAGPLITSTYCGD